MSTAVENADVEPREELVATLAERGEWPAGGQGDADFRAFDEGARGEDGEGDGGLLDEALEPVPGAGGDAAQVAHEEGLEVEDDEREVAVAEEEVGDFD